MKQKIKTLLNGIVRENPVWVLLLGTCPTLATTSTVAGAVGMGISLLVVLVCSNTVISLFRNFIPEKVRIPSYIVIIAGFVTVITMLVQGFLPDLYKTLGIFLPLIVVNCIILARAEAFASKNAVFDSILDGLGMGIGFTLALFLLGSVREILGSGSWFGIKLLPNELTLSIFSASSGGFLAFGFIIAVFSSIFRVKNGCSSCRKCGRE